VKRRPKEYRRWIEPRAVWKKCVLGQKDAAWLRAIRDPGFRFIPAFFPLEKGFQTVNNLKVAKFSHLLLDNEEICEVIDSVISKLIGRMSLR
jgi:hypothetical protein